MLLSVQFCGVELFPSEIPEFISTISGVIIGFVLAEVALIFRNKRQDKKEFKSKIQEFIIEYTDLIGDPYSMANYFIDQKQLHETENSTSFWQFIQPLAGEVYKIQEISIASKSIVLQANKNNLLVRLNKIVSLRNQFVELVKQFFIKQKEVTKLFDSAPPSFVDFDKMRIQYDELSLSKIAASNASEVMEVFNLSNLVIQQAHVFKNDCKDFTKIVCSELALASGIRELEIELAE